MAKLKFLIIHCSATPEGRNVHADEIVKWHTSEPPTGRGWSKPGYSKVVHLDGSIKTIQNYDTDHFISNNEITNGARGFNGVSRHFCYIGGVSADGLSKPKDTRTESQKATLAVLVKNEILTHPHIKVLGHNQISNKACPSFNVPLWLREIGVDDVNIY